MIQSPPNFGLGAFPKPKGTTTPTLKENKVGAPA